MPPVSNLNNNQATPKLSALCQQPTQFEHNSPGQHLNTEQRIDSTSHGTSLRLPANCRDRLNKISDAFSIQQSIANETLNCEANILTSQDIPVIDAQDLIQFSINHEKTPQWQRTIDQLNIALNEVGFFTLKNHGLNANAAKAVSHAFFNQPLSNKLTRAQHAGFQYGYSCVGEEKLSRSDDANSHNLENQKQGDPKESLNIPPLHLDWSWPDSAPEFDGEKFKGIMTQYYRDCETLTHAFLQNLACILDEPIDFFDTKMKEHMSVVRTLNYPASIYGDENTIRASAHTDYGLLTLLQTFGSSGLQVQNKTGSWINVQLSDPNDLVINIGDALSRMTNNSFKSTRHRVIQSDKGQRQSIAFFVNFNNKALIEPIQKYRKATGNYLPVTSGEYIQHKSGLSMGYVQ